MSDFWAGMDRVGVVGFMFGIIVGFVGGKDVTATLRSVLEAFEFYGKVRIWDMLHRKCVSPK